MSLSDGVTDLLIDNLSNRWTIRAVIIFAVVSIYNKRYSVASRREGWWGWWVGVLGWGGVG